MNHRSEGHASFGHLQQNQLTRYIGTHRITHGRMDLLMPFSNGKAWLRAWARLNGCDKVSFVAGFPDDICTEISGCDIPIVWCPHTSRHHRGHGVPPFAEVEIERFFERFSR